MKSAFLITSVICVLVLLIGLPASSAMVHHPQSIIQPRTNTWNSHSYSMQPFGIQAGLHADPLLFSHTYTRTNAAMGSPHLRAPLPTHRGSVCENNDFLGHRSTWSAPNRFHSALTGEIRTPPIQRPQTNFCPPRTGWW